MPKRRFPPDPRGGFGHPLRLLAGRPAALLPPRRVRPWVLPGLWRAALPFCCRQGASTDLRPVQHPIGLSADIVRLPSCPSPAKARPPRCIFRAARDRLCCGPCPPRPVNFRPVQHPIGLSADIVRPPSCPSPAKARPTRCIFRAARDRLCCGLYPPALPPPLPPRRVQRAAPFTPPAIDFAADLIRRALPAASGAVLGLILLSVSCPNTTQPPRRVQYTSALQKMRSTENAADRLDKPSYID